MIIGGVNLTVDESIIAIRMNWRIQLEILELDTFTPELSGRKPPEDLSQWGMPPEDPPPKYKRPKMDYWSHSIVKWLIQSASPFWNTIRTGGTVHMATSAYVSGRIWQATGGRVIKWAAMQSLKQMVVRPAVGTAGVLGAYFGAVAILGHDMYAMLENHPTKTKWLGQGLDLGGGAGGFGA